MDSNPYNSNPGMLAREAKQFTDSDVFKELFEDLRQQAYADIADSEPDEGSKRENAYYDLRALDRILMKLQSYQDNQTILEHRKTTE